MLPAPPRTPCAWSPKLEVQPAYLRFGSSIATPLTARDVAACEGRDPSPVDRRVVSSRTTVLTAPDDAGSPGHEDSPGPYAALEAQPGRSARRRLAHDPPGGASRGIPRTLRIAALIGAEACCAAWRIRLASPRARRAWGRSTGLGRCGDSSSAAPQGLCERGGDGGGGEAIELGCVDARGVEVAASDRAEELALGGERLRGLPRRVEASERPLVVTGQELALDRLQELELVAQRILGARGSRRLGARDTGGG